MTERGDIRHALTSVREEFQRLAPPVVLFNKSHSGSRLLARLMQAGGVFMGAQLNESLDATALLPLVEHLVTTYYPDYQPLWNGEAIDRKLDALVREAFRNHLAGFTPGAAFSWGWKLCETTYVLPVVDFLFPGARYVHLVRDGRDVAFSDHTPPNNPFWKKVYFNTDRAESWHGRGLRRRDYERASYLYNAQHWVNSVTIGRAFGSMLRERYREVRYEDLCLRCEDTARSLLTWVGAPRVGQAVAEVRREVRGDRVGVFQRQSPWKKRRVLRVMEQALASLGYE